MLPGGCWSSREMREVRERSERRVVKRREGVGSAAPEAGAGEEGREEGRSSLSSRKASYSVIVQSMMCE